MKAVLISIKPKYVADILNGKKTLELRKTFPKCDYPIDVYIYCTKEDSLCRIVKISRDRYICGKNFDVRDFPELRSRYDGKGKIVAKFTLRKVDKHHILSSEYILLFNPNMERKLEQLCLTKEDVMAYSHGEDYTACVWHIDDLVVFDKPLSLSRFDIKIRENVYRKRKAPQSWCYIDVTNDEQTTLCS